MTVRKLAYTINEAVEATSIGRKSIVAAIRAKQLHAVRVGAMGTKWVIPGKSLDEWLESLIEDES